MGTELPGGGRAHFRGRARWLVEAVECVGECGWCHVPDGSAPPQSHPRQAVDREAPAAAGRVLPSEAEHDPPAGDRGREPVLAEHALPVGGAGVRPRGGAQGGGLRGHQGGQNGQVPPAQVRGGPARPSQRHQEVGLIRSHGLTGRPPIS